MPARCCHHCQAAWESAHRTPGRSETCTECGGDLHCCLNCRFHTPGAPNECAEPNVERVLDKEKGNFCDYFVFAESGAPAGDRPSSTDGHQQFENLFKS